VTEPTKDASSLPVAVGELIAGKYRVERVLGRGGMGVVVAAMHEKLRQPVAIKMLLPEAKASENAVTRFMREARAAAAIHGEHVARVLDVGELSEGEGGVGGAPFIVMEYLEGRDLAAVFKASAPLPVEEAVGFVLQACEAIAEAHAAGIVHRDLKPSNLFLTRRPDGSPLVKVLDFGISKGLLKAAGEGTLTTASSFVGSPIYSPPEQLLAAHDVDARADIWALGTILYEGLAGRPPYVGDSPMHVASRIFHESPTSLAELRPVLPADLVAAVMKCLQKQPADRFPDVKALAEALAPHAPRASISAERVARIVSTPNPGLPSPLQVQAAVTASATAMPAVGPPSVRTPGQRRLIVAGLAAAGMVVGFVVFSGRSSSPPAAAPAAVGTPAAPASATVPGSASESASVTESASASASASATASASASASAAASASVPRPVGVPPKKNPLSVGVK
jgi:eukaryotic-like serine/threonine-protein kinase